jgi:hypothetical protein
MIINKESKYLYINFTYSDEKEMVKSRNKYG